MNRSKQPERRELWRQRIAQHRVSGQTVQAFCREHKLNEPSFYLWRKKLENSAAADTPARFALVETTKPYPQAQMLELVLSGGEKLLIPADAATLRLVLSALSKQA